MSNVCLSFKLKTKWLVFATSTEPGQPADPHSLTRLYTAGWPTWSVLSWYPSKGNGESQKMEVVLLNFSKFSRSSVYMNVFKLSQETFRNSFIWNTLFRQETLSRKFKSRHDLTLLLFSFLFLLFTRSVLGDKGLI